MKDMLIQLALNNVLAVVQVITSNPTGSTAHKWRKALSYLRDQLNIALPPEPAG